MMAVTDAAAAKDNRNQPKGRTIFGLPSLFKKNSLFTVASPESR
jgi:hypothetical protein